MNKEARVRTLPPWGPVVAFSVDRMAPLELPVGAGITAPLRLSLDLLGTDCEPVREMEERAESAWRDLGLRGAVHVFYLEAVTIQAVRKAEVRLLRARSPEVVLNVLGRARGGLLLPGFELSRSRHRLDRALATWDPRLVQWAEATGTVTGP